MKARKIELKTLNFVAPDGTDQSLRYNDLLNVVIASSGQGGISTDDVLKAMEIKQELSKANGALHLSDPDYAWLCARLNNTVRWTLANEQLAEFIKDVRGAELVEMKE